METNDLYSVRVVNGLKLIEQPHLVTITTVKKKHVDQVERLHVIPNVKAVRILGLTTNEDVLFIEGSKIKKADLATFLFALTEGRMPSDKEKKDFRNAVRTLYLD